ncbi:MAG: GAF domain-containing protein [Pyrinomonadaceae bacterium]
MIEHDADFAALFKRISDPAIVLSEAGERVLACNDAFAALAVRSCAQLTGMDAASLLQFEEATKTRAAEDATVEEEAAVVFVNGEYPLRVRVERTDCRWDEMPATLCLVRRVEGRIEETKETEAGGVITSAEMAALFEYLREATEQLEVINRVVAAVNSSRTIDEVFRLASEQMRGLIPFDRASIALCEEGGELLRVFAMSGARAGSLNIGSTGALTGSVTELALNERRMIVIPELSEEKRFNVYADLQQESFRSAICCPLFSTRGALGSLNLTCRTPRAYERKHLLALERLAAPFALAIEKVLLLEQAERRSQQMEAAARREELAGRIGRQLASSLDPSSVLQETVDALGAALGAECCHITLIEGEDDYALVNYEYLSGRDAVSLRGHRLPLGVSGFAQKVLTGDAPVAVSDVAALTADESSEDAVNEEDELLRLYRKLGVRTLLLAPVTTSGVRKGLIGLHDSGGARAWTQDDIELLGTVAREVSVALTNARLYEASRRRSAELEGLYKISRAFSTLTDTSEIYGRLTRAIAELIGGESCLIATYDRRRHTVRAEAPGYNTPPEAIRDFRFMLEEEGTSAYIYKTGEPFFSNDPATDARFNQNFIERYKVRSALSVPMRIKRDLIGFIYVANRPGGFRWRDVQLLEIFAAQAAETIANARLFATIQAQAEREAVVNRLLLSLQQANDSKRAVGIVVERVGEVLDLDRCLAVMFAESYWADFRGEWCSEGVAPISNDASVNERSPLPQWIKEHRQPLVAPDIREHEISRGIEDIVEKTGVKSLAAVPIMHQGRVVGTLIAQQTRAVRRWGEDDIDLLTAVATQVGSTLENARLISELREANRLKDEFLATLSHELRTPLTAIKGWVELLAESELMESDEEFAEGISVIKSSADSLTQLISDLLDLSRIQRRGLRLECELFDLNLAVLDAVQVVRQAAAARRQMLRVELDKSLPLAYVDAHRMQQIFWNLLTNAIKFTPEEGIITVRSRLLDAATIFLEEKRGEGPPSWIVVEVEDTGEGITPEFLPYVWDRFRQADGSSTRRHGGLGIGLALVKELTEAHGGEVEARSDKTGTTFIVRLPLASA